MLNFQCWPERLGDYARRLDCQVGCLAAVKCLVNGWFGRVVGRVLPV